MKGHANIVESVVFSSDSKTVVSGSSDGTIRFWDVAQGTETRRMESALPHVRAIALTPDGTSIIAGGGQNAWGDQVGHLAGVAERKREMAEAMKVLAIELQGKRKDGAPFKADGGISLESCRVAFAETGIDAPGGFWIAVNGRLDREAVLLGRGAWILQRDLPRRLHAVGWSDRDAEIAQRKLPIVGPAWQIRR